MVVYSYYIITNWWIAITGIKLLVVHTCEYIITIIDGRGILVKLLLLVKCAKIKVLFKILGLW